MADPRVIQVMQAFKAALARREAEQMAAMARRWVGVQDRLEDVVSKLAAEFDARRAAGEAITEAALWRLERYQSLLVQVRQENERYAGWAAGQIEAEQLALGELGIEHAAAAIGASGIAGSFDLMNVSAVENMAGLAGNGSPLGELLAQSWPDSVEGLTQALIDGTAIGRNPRETARAMMGEVDGSLDRMLRIARTEQLRVYRAAALESYRASGVVLGYRRLAAKQARTCIACLVEDGKFYELDQDFYDHVNGRCSMVPVVKGFEDQSEAGQTGREWFEGLPDDAQRDIMGSAKWQAWKEGAFDLGDIVRRTGDSVWGRSLGERSLAELSGEARHTQVTGASFFKGELDSVASARQIGEARGGWQEQETALLDRFLPEYDLSGAVDRTIGLWGAPEPSFNVYLEGARADILALARDWGRAYDQDAVVLLLPNPEGTAGALSWDPGRKLSNAELDAVLQGIRRVNDEMAGEFSIGLTVKDGRFIEYWAQDADQRQAAQTMIARALELAGLDAGQPRWAGGYDFVIVMRGVDY